MSKRGNRRTSLRVRLAVAAAVVAGGGATGVVAVSAGHSGPLAAASAGYYQAYGRTMSYTSAMSRAMRGWETSPGTSLTTISHMQPVHNYWTQPWHRAIIFIQRGTVVAVSKHEVTVRSADGRTETWHVNHGTKTENVGGSSTGLSAMTGGTTRVPSWWQMNTKVHGVAQGDLVFVFGERENHTLKAQLVLFAAPAMTTATPAATPTATMTAPTAAPTGTMPGGTMPGGTMPAGTMPAATTTAPMPGATTTAPMPATATPAATPTGSAPVFSGNNS